MESLIELKGIYKKFGKLEVLRDVNLSVTGGSCIALIGPNGCGKTTMMKSLLNMVIPDRGEVFFKGKSIALGVEYRKEIGYMPQIGRYPENMTIAQVLDMIKFLRGHPSELDLELFDAFHIQDILHKRMGTLSGGTRQKVSAVIAFLFNPPVYILDEPTAGLDPMATEILKDKILRERSCGKLIFITSHLLAELDELITEVIFMQDGTIRLHMQKEELRNTTGAANLPSAIYQILKQQS